MAFSNTAVLLSGTPSVDIAIRSYEEKAESDRHEFAQLVLPLSGEVHLEIEDKQGRLDPLHGALVVPGAWHSQYSTAVNRSLILNVHQSTMNHEALERLSEKSFAAISPATRKLMEFMEIMTTQETIPPSLVNGWVPLLLDSLALATPQPQSRLSALLAQIEGNPGFPWTTESMAQAARMSVSRLHALFRSELNASPHAWLLQKRLDLACRYLTSTSHPISQVALNTGFFDQSSLTRTMRQYMDTTPAAYRQQSREIPTKSQ